MYFSSVPFMKPFGADAECSSIIIFALICSFEKTFPGPHLKHGMLSSSSERIQLYLYSNSFGDSFVFVLCLPHCPFHVLLAVMSYAETCCVTLYLFVTVEAVLNDIRLILIM